MRRADVLEWVNRIVRVEVRLRTAELKRLTLRQIGDWLPGDCRRAWAEKVARIDLTEGETMQVREVDGYKARDLVDFNAYLAGMDFRQLLKPATFYRRRKQLKDCFGIDIGVPVPEAGVANIVSLRRLIEAEPALRPHWADEVDELLAA